MKKDGYIQVHLDQVAYTHRLTEQKGHTAYTCTFTEGKSRIPWKTKFSVEGIGPKWFWSMVLRNA